MAATSALLKQQLTTLMIKEIKKSSWLEALLESIKTHYQRRILLSGNGLKSTNGDIKLKRQEEIKQAVEGFRQVRLALEECAKNFKISGPPINAHAVIAEIQATIDVLETMKELFMVSTGKNLTAEKEVTP